MATLNFCDTCGEKQVKEVKAELQKLITKRRHDPKRCCFCNVQLPSSPEGTEVIPDTSEITNDPDWHYDISEDEEEESVEEIELETVTAHVVKQHYVNPEMITKGLDERVLQMMNPAEDPAKPFKCKLCLMDCAKIYNFLRHLKIKHDLDYLQEKPYKCDYCLEGFTCFTHMQDHLTTHLADDNKMFSCELCGSSLKTIYSYRRHVQILHNSERNRPCRYCGKLFRHMSEVTGHEKLHTNNKPHVCDQCPKAFRTAGRLKRHQQVHSDFKPYMCNFCNLKVKDKEYLKKHIKMRHTGSSVKQHAYACSQCTYSCSDLKDMDAHKMTHIASKVSDILYKSRTNLILESVQTDTSAPNVVFQLAEEAVTNTHGTEKEIAHQEEVVTSAEDQVNSALPPETIQAISKLLEEAGNGSSLELQPAADDVLYQCMECKFQTPDVAAMRSHMSVHLPDGLENATEQNAAGEAVMYRCEDCGCTSSNASELYAHVLTDHQDGKVGGTGNEVEFQEITMEESSPQEGQGEALAHQNDVDEDDKRPKCDNCSLIFTNLTDLRIHQASHISVKTSARVARKYQMKVKRGQSVASPPKSQVKIQATFAQVGDQGNSENSAKEIDAHETVTKAASKPCERGQVQPTHSEAQKTQELSTSKSQKEPGPSQTSAQKQTQPSTRSQAHAREEPQPSTRSHAPAQKQAHPSTRSQTQAQKEPQPSTRSQTQAQKEPQPSTRSQTQAREEPHPSTRSQTQAQKEPHPSTRSQIPAQKQAHPSTRSQTQAQKEPQPSTRSQTQAQKEAQPSTRLQAQVRKQSEPITSASAIVQQPSGTSPQTERELPAAKRLKLSDSLISLDGKEPTSLRSSTKQSSRSPNTYFYVTKTAGSDSNQAAKATQANRPKVLNPKDTDGTSHSNANRMQAMLAGTGVREDGTMLKKILKTKTHSVTKSKSSDVDFNRMTFM
ncbi:uncharacterized protein [Amphiura filiformis]|uniref:uncharacterized protein n=1 Tax=Amphiura filiformis TaxID=82378 RepID=UPI003B211E07